ncbi:hypothetical protein CLV78_102357 [Aliiruegeria haliotis]|uniref:Uncharacterized protein n=1 Tax=Aliiruegeria haliotis TaxID=1280846 RepID=A0A2T0RVK6_9RHOB|nr:hypothetical protein [Aliiruegeria haliotis]PRY25180.1 hypothetical protein CLV78_102357 [Aliiruegeria haliotis]
MAQYSDHRGGGLIRETGRHSASVRQLVSGKLRQAKGKLLPGLAESGRDLPFRNATTSRTRSAVDPALEAVTPLH